MGRLIKKRIEFTIFLAAKAVLMFRGCFRESNFPKEKEIFEALNLTPLNKVKVVILGQDPYHGENQAHGLAFSVRPKSSLPPSLRNIFKELHNDLGAPSNSNGYLHSWATQGVLLLNSVLTVEKNKAGSHAGYGWERFTDSIISLINSHRERVVFFLWGAYAQNKKKLIDSDKHLILSSSHPSPLSAHRGFFGSKHFSKANQYLTLHSKKCISWN